VTPRAERKDQDFDIRIQADGAWLHEGRPIARAALVRLFASILRRDAAGAYWLETPVERGRIAVEDSAFVGVEVWRDEAGDVRVRTNVEDVVRLDADHALRMTAVEDGPRAYITVRPGLEARLLRAPFYALVDLAERRGGRLGVSRAGGFFVLGDAE